MVVCVLYARFELLAALGERRALVSEPVALAPEAGREQVVGEVSAPAEAFGVVRGMRLGEAMTRCPELRLVPPDPAGTRELWSAVLDGLEGIGAAVESDRAGEAFFEASGLHGIHALRGDPSALRGEPSGSPLAGTPRGDLGGVLAAARRALGGGARTVAAPGGFAIPGGARLGAAPSRFAARAAALQARPRRKPTGAAKAPRPSPLARGTSSLAGRPHAPLPGCLVVPDSAIRGFLAPLPVGLLRARPELQALPEVLERLGLRSLGELAALPARAVAERFGHPGLLALDLARGRDIPLEPRRPPEPVEERIELPEAASGPQLERALDLLIARLLARRERRGRSLRALAVSARFVAGGTWRTAVTLRQASADPARIRLALAGRLAELPAPADSLGLEVEAFGPPAHDQERLLEEGTEVRRARLGEAVHQARQAAGDDAALRILEVDPGSRIPERRALLAPFVEEGGG